VPECVFAVAMALDRRAGQAPSQRRIRTLARRFWEHTIRDEFDFERHVDYVHFNPVKHKLVRRVRDWPYSSFHVFVRRGLLPADWAGDVDESLMDFGERRA